MAHIAYVIISASFRIASSPGLNLVILFIMKTIIINSAGPEAEARNLGANTAVIQKGLAARPEYKNAVTVWMLIAHGIEIIIMGLILVSQ